MKVVDSELGPDGSQDPPDGVQEHRTETGPGGASLSQGALPTGPFAVALQRALRRRVARRRPRPRLEGDHVGVQAEAVIKAWLSSVDYEPPIFVAAWEQAARTTFLLTGYVKKLPRHPLGDAAGGTISFAHEGDWEDTPRGRERKVSATVTGQTRPRLRSSRFAQADGVLVPLGYGAGGVLHLPLLGPPLSVSGPGADRMATALVVRAVLRLGKGACRAVVPDGLGAPFEATGEVETFPGSGTEGDDIMWGLLPELRARRDCFSDKAAANFREHALIRRGHHLPVMLLGFAGHAGARRVYAGDHSEDGIATLVIGENDLAERRMSVSARRVIVDLAIGLPPLSLRPALLSGDELHHAARLLRTEAEPVQAMGMPPTVERSGFAANPHPMTETAPIRLSIASPLELVNEDRKPEPIQEIGEEESAPARRIFCLGQLRIEVGGEVVQGRLRAKSRELIAMLVAHPEGIVKEVAQESLWPEGDPEKSDQNLRQCITNIRKHMGAVEGETDIIDRVDALLRLDSRHVWSDVAAFQGALDSKGSEQPETHLREAVDLYRADFCQGVYDWTEPSARRLRGSFIDAAMQLADILERQDDVGAALDVIDRAIVADQYAEHLYRRGMELEAKRGRRDAVMRRYRRLERLLADDLDVAPQDATVSAFRSFTQG
ncbi:MAG: hypothetical protein M3345_05870 [Actinomycetota bacterium]|nr:hypothetical protein [Actinomycetota bacterium]